MKSFKGIALQLLKEFWLPFVFAAGWAYFGNTGNGWSLAGLVARFSTAFFFMSWMLGQLFRVAKQVETKSSLSRIGTRLDDVVARLEDSAREALAWSTGGDTYAYLAPTLSGEPNEEKSALVVLTVGHYPLHKLNARIVDLDAMQLLAAKDQASLTSAETYLELGQLDGEMAYLDVTSVRLGSVVPARDRRFNIFFMARNGSWVQHLRFRSDGTRWYAAYKVQRPLEDNTYELLEESIDGLPSPETLDWA